MQIGAFVTRLGTTKETVRHYEDLQLLTPAWRHGRREYGEKELLDFQVIVELKSLGMGLREIQLLFDCKRAFGCGNSDLVAQTIAQLTGHLAALRQEEEILRTRRLKLEQQLAEIKRIAISREP